ncbi:hypothetical protein [Mucilaginibacter glaciei]|uniref:Secreted protein (Por secretion system target) n=1 Tax=Mucilaginibacter glaciei TaxID=2772109 RepID=A0A926NTL6_9SPHI|nr:hypothetical protein [Mucilaginibacter glaciei]MBD1391543.1 hypothetical protein [Mucilaginibacter glaciei]
MKKSITLLALILTLSSALFAKTTPADELITINPLRTALGVGISVNANDASRSVVRIYNADNTIQFIDQLAKKGTAAKAYILKDLEDGNYTIEVATKNQVVKKQIHVYNEDGKKSFFIFQ